MFVIFRRILLRLIVRSSGVTELLVGKMAAQTQQGVVLHDAFFHGGEGFIIEVGGTFSLLPPFPDVQIEQN